MRLVKVKQFQITTGPSTPGQIARLAWFLTFFLSPMAGPTYVSLHDLSHGGREALIHIALLFFVSLAISSLSAATAPFQHVDEHAFTKVARANLFFALVGTVSFAILANDPSSTSPTCQIGTLCRTYPVGWLSLAGMHYCYSIVAYIIAHRSPK